MKPGHENLAMLIGGGGGRKKFPPFHERFYPVCSGTYLVELGLVENKPTL